ncbi:DUF996 domain-containing protein [Candidatus Bathyarchaeota archaeon A05DMB-3]|nr:DUF996 domain-containing protein [Candidatus Bathyarchaeota archaeon A05DMB-3]
MGLESNKTLGGIGAILMAIGFLGFFGSAYVGFLVLVGAILVLIALKGFADQYQEGGIFNNALYGFITVIIGAVATAAIFIVLVLQMLATIEIYWTNPIAVQQYFMDNLNAIWSLAAGAIAAWVVFFIFMVASAVLVRKSLNSLSEKSGEKIFGTAGLLWLIGAVLSIILIGFIVVWISWILIAVGFFSIKAASVQPMPVQPAPPPPPQPPQ